MPHRLFIEANTIASIIWIIVVAGAGFLAGQSFIVAHHYLKFAEIGVLAILILLVVIMHFISKKFKKDENFMK